MYKTIVPNLVSIDTQLTKMKGVRFFQGFDFFTPTDVPLPFHYAIVVTSKIDIPRVYDFRNGHYMRTGEKWYYERTFMGKSMRMCYDAASRTFYVHPWYYHAVHFVIGGIIPPVNLIVSIMLLDLFLAGYVVMSGFAVQCDKKAICVTAPSYNGKTEFLKKMLRQKSDLLYIAEDSLLIDYKNFSVFPTAPAQKNMFFGRSNMDDTYFVPYAKIDRELSVDRFLLWQNSTSQATDITHKNILDFLWLNSLTFLNTIFLRSYIFEHNLTDQLARSIADLSNINKRCEFTHTYDFDLDPIIYGKNIKRE